MVSSATGIPSPATTTAADPLQPSQAETTSTTTNSITTSSSSSRNSTAPPISAEPLRSGSSGSSSIPTTKTLKLNTNNKNNNALLSPSPSTISTTSTILLPLASTPTPPSVSVSASASTSTVSLSSSNSTIRGEDNSNSNNSRDKKAPSTTSSIGGSSSSSLAQQSLRQYQLRDKSLVAKEMLLLHTSGSVKVGEVMRYTITYTPIHDRILPPPSALHLRIKNTEPIAMRAAYLHGPYVLYVSAKSSTYNQWTPVTDPREEGGYPEFDPNLRPGGSWECQLPVPRRLRTKVMEKERSRRLSSSGGRPAIGQRKTDDEKDDSVTWIVEVVSQMIFSSTSRIHFDLLLGRDERSLSQFNSVPLDEGSYSRAITFKVQNTEQLWNTPPFPGENEQMEPQSQPGKKSKPKKNKGPKKVHLVMISHGLHSNTGADMLYLKESIDKSAARALESSRQRRKEGRKKEKEMMAQRKKMEEEAHKLQKEGELTRRLSHVEDLPTKAEVLDELRKEAEETKGPEAKESKESSEETKGTKIEEPTVEGPKAEEISQPSKAEAEKTKEAATLEPESDSDDSDDDDDDEQVITRGFHDNVCRTERGIKYLGKRLARHVFALTYPHRPFPPSLRDKQHPHRSTTFPLHLHNNKHDNNEPDAAQKAKDKLASAKYKVTSISFIGHSLGGLVQTYAIAYIHAHSPEFFKEVEPVNFIALASPFLGLSNENPIYIRFALDFGVVGKTGQDLGLSWRPPTAFGAFTGGVGVPSMGGGGGGGSNAQEGNMAGTKPLLRILPTGPAKEVLHMFRNRTVYANVVNDGIVPLRTSCLLFLDWKGLGRVEKARRQNEGPVGQVSGLVGWGWGQLISGQGERTHKRSWSVSSKKSDQLSLQQQHHQNQQQQPQGEGQEGGHPAIGEAPRTDERPKSGASTGSSSGEEGKRSGHPAPNPFSALLTLFRPHAAKKKAAIYKRSQVIPSPTFPPSSNNNSNLNDLPSPRSPIAERDVTRSPEAVSPTGATAAGADVDEMDPTKNHLGEEDDMMEAPPRTTLLEAASDVLNPPLPTLEYIINPNKRPRTIFHDRVYHPNDIPPVPARTRRTLSRAGSATYAPTTKDNKDGKVGGESGAGGNESRSSTNESLLSTTGSGSGSSTTPTITTTNTNANVPVGGGNGGTKSNMRPEEKIARAYHDGLSWRKVLVRLEPDAHNNIIVRREFSNAYGWPVVKHLCDTHFEDTYESRIRDDEEGGEERALEIEGWKGGEEVVHHQMSDGKEGGNISSVPAVGAGNVDDDDYAARNTTAAAAVREGNDGGSSSGRNGPTNVSDGEDDSRMKFRPRRRLSTSKRTLSFKRNRSTSPPLTTTALAERADDSGVWSDSALIVSDDEDEEEERKRLIKNDEEVRRLKQIDSFLGKGKGGAVVGKVTVDSPPATATATRSGSSGGGGMAVGLSGLGGFGGLMGYEAAQSQSQQDGGGNGGAGVDSSTAVGRLTSLKVRDGEAERRREIGRKVESGMDASAARRGS